MSTLRASMPHLSDSREDTVPSVLATRSLSTSCGTSRPDQQSTLPNPSLLESGNFPAKELAELAAREGRRPRVA